jgi:hypothetical protein
MRSAENSGGSYHCDPDFSPGRVKQPELVLMRLLLTVTGALGGREGFVWCKCITTDYVSVPQLLAWMLWQPAKPNMKRKDCGVQFQTVPWNVLLRCSPPFNILVSRGGLPRSIVVLFLSLLH